MRYLWSVLFLTACNAPQSALPLQAVPVYGELPYVRALSGKRELRMGADSGSELPAVLFPETAAELGSPPTTDEMVQCCAARVEVAPGCSAGPCFVALTEHAPMDGLLGWPLLRQRVWHLDWGHGQHSFADEVPQGVREQWASLPLTSREHASILIPGWGACMLDTGAPNAVYLPTEIWKQIAAELPERGYYYGVSPAAGGAFVAECAKVSELRLGPLCLHHTIICESFCPDRDDIILGCGLLEQIECWLDAPKGRFYYRPYR